MNFKETLERTVLPFVEKNKKRVLVGAEVFIFLLLLIFMVSMGRNERTTALTQDEMQAVFREQPGFENLTEATLLQLRKNYDIDAVDCDVILYYYAPDQMDVTELVVLKSSDSDFLASSLEAAQTRIADEITAFEGYAPDSCALLEDAKILQTGDYLFVAVGNDSDSWQAAFQKAVRG